MAASAIKIVVWSGDTLNPYSAAVAGVIASNPRVLSVELWTPRSDWTGDLPDDVESSSVPGVTIKSFGDRGGLLGRLERLMRLLVMLVRCMLTRRFVIISFVHPKQLKYPTLLSALGLRCGLVVHNAGTTRGANGESKEEARLLRSALAIVHTPEQARSLTEGVKAPRVVVARLPAYLRCLAAVRERTSVNSILIAGRAARGVVGEQGLVRDFQDSSFRGRTVLRTARVDQHGERVPISGPEWVQLFARADVLIAPLQDQTASASILEALVAHLPVVSASLPLQPRSHLIRVEKGRDVIGLCDSAIDAPVEHTQANLFDALEWNRMAAEEWLRVIDPRLKGDLELH